jgi:hypothetical protein
VIQQKGLEDTDARLRRFLEMLLSEKMWKPGLKGGKFTINLRLQLE